MTSSFSRKQQAYYYCLSGSKSWISHRRARRRLSRCSSGGWPRRRRDTRTEFTTLQTSWAASRRRSGSEGHPSHLRRSKYSTNISNETPTLPVCHSRGKIIEIWNQLLFCCFWKYIWKLFEKNNIIVRSCGRKFRFVLNKHAQFTWNSCVVLCFCRSRHDEAGRGS